MTPSMDVRAVISQIEQAGRTLAVQAGRLRYKIPRPLPRMGELLDALRVHRDEAIRILCDREGERTHAAPCGSPQCAGCYEVEPGRRIHPPRSSTKWEAWVARWQPTPKDRIQ
jgi:hypothetical protein